MRARELQLLYICRMIHLPMLVQCCQQVAQPSMTLHAAAARFFLLGLLVVGCRATYVAGD